MNRKLRMGMVGGGKDAFIGAIHRHAAGIDGLIELVCGALSINQETGARTDLQVTVEAVLINILNPKLSIFFLAFLPQFMSTDEAHPVPHMLMLNAVFMLMTFVAFVAYGLFAASVRDHVISRPRIMMWMRRTFAGAFAALGAKLAFTER